MQSAADFSSSTSGSSPSAVRFHVDALELLQAASTHGLRALDAVSSSTAEEASSSSTGAGTDASSASDPTTWRNILATIALFAFAGLLEIGGGWLYWQFCRDAKPGYYLVVGMLLLLLYGYIPTLQPPGLQFGRVYAVYGGIFIVMSLLFAWAVDGVRPDRGGQSKAAKACASGGSPHRMFLRVFCAPIICERDASDGTDIL
jgi:small multidrug resistance family-3 protein